MPGIRSAARPHAGVARRPAPFSDAATAGEHASGMKQKRGVAPAARPKMVSTSRAAGLEDSPADPRPKRAKVTDDDVTIKKPVTFAAAAVKMPVNAGQERLKKRLAAEFDALCELVKKAEALSSRGKNGRVLPRPEAPVVARGKAPPAKRRKPSPLVEKIHIDAPQMLPEEGEIVVVPDKDEDCMIDICGGVSPVATRDASPLVSLEKADDQPKINIVPAEEEEQDECVDICGGTPLVPPEVASEAFSPMYSSDSSSSDSESGSDSDDSSSSDSNSDDDESVDSPAPAAVSPPQENNSPAPPAENVTSSLLLGPASEAVQSTKLKIDCNQTVISPPPPPAQPRAPASSSVVAQSTEPKQNLPISVLLAKAKEARQIQAQKVAGWEREKTRRMVREMEAAVLPDQSIHLRDLEQLGIKQFDYVLEELLGISLRPDV